MFNIYVENVRDLLDKYEIEMQKYCNTYNKDHNDLHALRHFNHLSMTLLSVSSRLEDELACCNLPFSEV